MNTKPNSTLPTEHAPYTPYTPYTLHLTLRTFHIFHFSLQTLTLPPFALYSSHFTLYTPNSTLHTLRTIFPTQHSTVYTLHLHSTLYTPPHSTLHSLHWYSNRGRMHKTVEITCFILFLRSVLRDCIGIIGCFLVVGIISLVNTSIPADISYEIPPAGSQMKKSKATLEFGLWLFMAIGGRSFIMRNI